MKLSPNAKIPLTLPRPGLYSMYSPLILAGLLLTNGLPPHAAAQSVTGSISGIVTDSQDAVVAGAEVTATNTATGVSVKTQTNSAGVYSIPYLRIGPYEVRITAPGMKESVIVGILVDQNNISRVDTTLELGNLSQSIKVEAAAPLLQQESTTYDGVVDRSSWRIFPSLLGARHAIPPRSRCWCRASWSQPRPALNSE